MITEVNATTKHLYVAHSGFIERNANVRYTNLTGILSYTTQFEYQAFPNSSTRILIGVANLSEIYPIQTKKYEIAC